MDNIVYALIRDGELMAVYSTYQLANKAKYNGTYGGHWDSFEIEETELDPK